MNYVHRCKTYKKPANFTFVAGKFNTKIGKSNVKNPIIGRYSRGHGNKYNR